MIGMLREKLNLNKIFINGLLAFLLLAPATVISSPLEVFGIVKEGNRIKPETKVYVSCFGNDTIIYTNEKGLYDVILDVPFNSGYVTIRNVNCVEDTISNIVFYASNQQLIVSNFELCKSNFRTYLTGNVYYKKIPARGALIELSLNNFHTILELLQTDSNGHFESFMGVGTNNSGTMYARVKDCTGPYIYNSVDFKDGDTLNLSFVKCKSPGETLLTGQVMDGKNTTRKEAVKLLLYVFDRAKKELVFTNSKLTSLGGGYEFFLDDTDQYLIKALPVSEHSFMFPTYTNGATFWDDDPIINFVQLENQVRKNIPMTQNFQIIGDKSIKGKIVIENAKGLSQKQPAVLLLSMDNEPVSYTFADENGNYNFNRLSAGDYYIWVDDPGKLTIPIKAKLENNIVSLTLENIVVTDYAIGSSTTSQTETAVSQNTLGLYPNPFVNFIRLNLEEERSAEVQIISISGKLMKTVIISSENKIETSDLPQGIYLIKVKTETETSIQRMIKN